MGELALRTANRVLVELASWPAADNEQLYAGARAPVETAPDAYGKRDGGATLPLAELFADRTFSIQATSSHSQIRDTRWIAMKAKDGIVDAQRERFQARSDIERSSPDVALRLRLFRDRATLLLDTSGEPLDRRGYRVSSTAKYAARAARGGGSPPAGTGAPWSSISCAARGLFSPRRVRSRGAWRRIACANLWAVRTLARPRTASSGGRSATNSIPAPDPQVKMVGVDLAREAHQPAAQRNLAAAGLLGQTDLVEGDAFAFDPPVGPGLVVANPPHGEALN